ncbi:MAG: hypothetical protein Q4G50_01985 [Corynebacterium sp.]|uniref:hypothetical protein n=1 Tax=Corynebacterium sp. TaxID=1720 RepID=UPI0026DFDF1D|nr:hypothetical protein [Corynebacterium sp.]MDO5668752.1 hypothetical protein [Corynebacterium sp.]
MDYVISAVRRTAAIPLDALRLLARHWAALLTVIALGLGLRALVIWAAVIVSGWSSLAAVFLIPLAPIAVMTSLITALWLLRPSLPYLSRAVSDPTQGSTHVRLLTIGGLLIPFLTVYSSNGLLREDTRAYIHDATLTETSRNLFTADFGRSNFEITWVLISLIVVALVLRKIIGVFALGERSVGWAGASAYLEVLWMVTFSVILTGGIAWVRDWVFSRAVLAPVIGGWDVIRGFSGPVGDVFSWLVALVSRADDVIIIPVAWLTLGATIYGAQLAAKGASASNSPRNRLQVEARKALDEAAQPLLGPVKSTMASLGRIAAAGLGPMVMFCLLFTLAKSTEIGVLYLGRAIVGPLDRWDAVAVDPYILVIARLVYFAAALVFIAPALDRLLRASSAESSETPVNSR